MYILVTLICCSILIIAIIIGTAVGGGCGDNEIERDDGECKACGTNMIANSSKTQCNCIEGFSMNKELGECVAVTPPAPSNPSGPDV